MVALLPDDCVLAIRQLKLAVVFLLTLLLSYVVSRFLVRKSTKATVSAMVLLFVALVLWLR